MKRLMPILIVIALPLLAGCGSKSASNPPASPDTSAASAPAPADTSGVLAKSRYDDGPRAADEPVDAALAAQGEKLFQSKGCVTCHAWGKRVVGPDLKGVPAQRTSQWMENQILHPEVMTKEDPIAHALLMQYHTQMTNQHLTPDQAKMVVEYLKKRQKESK